MLMDARLFESPAGQIIVAMSDRIRIRRRLKH
jgi:hypothetical protein